MWAPQSSVLIISARLLSPEIKRFWTNINLLWRNRRYKYMYQRWAPHTVVVITLLCNSNWWRRCLCSCSRTCFCWSRCLCCGCSCSCVLLLLQLLLPLPLGWLLPPYLRGQLIALDWRGKKKGSHRSLWYCDLPKSFLCGSTHGLRR